MKTSVPFRYHILIALLFSSLLKVTAQHIQYERDSLDIGYKFINDTLIYHFFFEVLSESVKIQEVTTDCSCVMGKFSLDRLYRNETGVIELQILPYQYGHFERSAFVKWKNSNKVDTLKMSSYITPKGLFIKERYPIKKKLVRLQSHTLLINYLVNHHVNTKDLYIYNHTDRIISLSDKTQLPIYLTIENQKDIKIPPKSSQTLRLFFNLRTNPLDIGFHIDDIKIGFSSEDRIEELVKVRIQTTILDKIVVSKDSSGAKIDTPETIKKLGRLYSVDKKNVNFEIINTGSKDLEVHRIETEAGVKLLSKSRFKIAPHSRSIITVELKDTPRTGTQIRSIGIFSNAANAPFLKLSTSFYIKK